MDNVGFVVAGYTVTGLVLAGYAASLFARGRRARLRARAVAERLGPGD